MGRAGGPRARRQAGRRRAPEEPSHQKAPRLNRGDVYDVDWPGAGRHPAVVVTRDVAIQFLSNVTVVLVTRTIRGLRTEVPLGPEHGLDGECVANCDNVLTVRKASLMRRRGALGPVESRLLNDALRIALELD